MRLIPSNLDHFYPARVLEEDGLDRAPGSHQSVIDLVGALADRHQISAIYPLLEICRAATNRSHLTIAVLGRFKAGKSSFIPVRFRLENLKVIEAAAKANDQTVSEWIRSTIHATFQRLKKRIRTLPDILEVA